MKRLTIRQRLALWFTIGFIVMGTIVRMIVFWRLDRSLSDLDDPAEIAALKGFDEFDLPIDRRPDEVTLVDGRTLRDVIEVAQQEFRDDTLRELFIWSGIAVLIIAVLAAVVGWWLSGRALAPIDRITRSARSISAHSLDRRIGYDGPADEVSALASTVDDMLDRIEGGVAAQRQFAAMASHELKTPLAVIGLEADMAYDDPTSTSVRELAERVGAGSRRATRLVDQLLELSRSQVGLLDSAPVDIGEVWEDVVEARRPRFDEAAIRLDAEVEPAVVDGDLVLLRSLAGNLVDNAIAHNHTNGFVAVRVRAAGSEAIVSVENSGPLLDAATLARIDEPFQRGVANPQQLGHGMGMTIIRTIVDRHGGSLEVVAREQGGLFVRITLPST